MTEAYYENKIFENTNYSSKNLSGIEFMNCTFKQCNFNNSILKNANFLDCQFDNCIFSLTELHNTGIKNVRFNHCKLMGLLFEKCNDFAFAVEFQNCKLDYASFFQKKMKKTNFADCSLKNVDFSQSDLTQSNFNNCDLLDAIFANSILEKADFTSAINYTINPEINKLKKAKFSYTGISGLLTKYDIVIKY